MKVVRVNYLFRVKKKKGGGGTFKLIHFITIK